MTTCFHHLEKVKLRRGQLFATPWTVACQATMSMEFSRTVGSDSLLQGIFPTQRSNLGLLHCRQILYCPSHQGSPFTSLSHLNSTIILCS